MIPQFRKALEAISDSLFAQPFLNRRPLKFATIPVDFAESTGTNTRYSDFCKRRGERRISHEFSIEKFKFNICNQSGELKAGTLADWLKELTDKPQNTDRIGLRHL
jgi:hypothetical protein